MLFSPAARRLRRNPYLLTAMSYIRVALLCYRGHPHVGGQGIYVRNLSRALAELGHQVSVFAGPPYPELDGSVELVRVPSLDLYRPDAPFRRPALDRKSVV